MLGAWVHPRRLVSRGQAENGVSDEKIMDGAGLQQEEAVAVALADAMLS